MEFRRIRTTEGKIVFSLLHWAGRGSLEFLSPLTVGLGWNGRRGSLEKVELACKSEVCFSGDRKEPHSLLLLPEIQLCQSASPHAKES